MKLSTDICGSVWMFSTVKDVCRGNQDVTLGACLLNMNHLERGSVMGFGRDLFAWSHWPKCDQEWSAKCHPVQRWKPSSSFETVRQCSGSWLCSNGWQRPPSPCSSCHWVSGERVHTANIVGPTSASNFTTSRSTNEPTSVRNCSWKEWANLLKLNILRVIRSMQRHCQAVIIACGLHNPHWGYTNVLNVTIMHLTAGLQ